MKTIRSIAIGESTYELVKTTAGTYDIAVRGILQHPLYSSYKDINNKFMIMVADGLNEYFDKDVEEVIN